MNRMTEHLPSDGSAVVRCDRPDVMVDVSYVGEPGGVYFGSVIDKLADYEDTGYSPIEIKSLEGERNAMRKVVDGYRNAEADGVVVRLPCRVGDMVYYKRGNDIIGDTVERIVFDGVDNQVMVGAHKVYTFWDFGRNVFRSREDAEASREGC